MKIRKLYADSCLFINRYNLRLSIILIFGLLTIESCRHDTDFTNSEIENLKINQIQIIASHNSYRQKTYPPLLAFLVNLKNTLPPQLNPEGLDYEHLPFDQQLNNYTVRGLEIDIYNDPNGGLFYNRKGNAYIGEPVESGIDALKAKGKKVLHIPDIDYNTGYYSFFSALTAVKNWSDAHPNHLPLFIHLETKEFSVGDILIGQGFTKTVNFNKGQTDSIDVEIKAVFGENLNKVLTPDKVRNGKPTLREVFATGQLPTLKQARGKIIFVMEGPANDTYLENHPSLSGRACFIYAEVGKPESGFILLNEAKDKKSEITQRVREGYIVRTRSDVETKEARSGDYSSMTAAFESGAQIISTDYYKADARGQIAGSGWSTFKVVFPNGELARINAVTAADKIGLGKIAE